VSRIGIIVPNVGMNEAAVAERHAYLKRHARPDSVIDFFVNEAGPPAIESQVESDEAGVEVARKIRMLKDEGYDAFITWCGSDPGLEAAREIAKVPVIGPGQAALHYASMLGTRMTWIAPMGDPRRIRSRIRAHGMSHLVSRVRIIGVPVLELRRDMADTRASLGTHIARAIDEDEADVVVLGCMALFGVAATLKAPVPVVDPVLSAVLMAESLATMGRPTRSAD